MALLEVDNLVVRYPVQGSGGWLGRPRFVHALNGVSLRVDTGETLGVVGESGCGKSTLARALMHLVHPASGQIRFAGEDLTTPGAAATARLRRGVQLVFQDPYGSLNPRLTIGDTLDEVLRVHSGLDRNGRRQRVRDLLERVELRAEYATRYPHELSGGQRQRLGIARVLAMDPRVVLLDEPVASLDVSVRAQIVNLLTDLQRRLGLAYVFIGHDLAVVAHLSTRILVMYLGRVVESAAAADLVARPQHPYTRALLASVPEPDPARRHERAAPLEGEVPSPLSPPPGCTFHPRCPLADERCRTEAPDLAPHGADAAHLTACHHAAAEPARA